MDLGLPPKPSRDSLIAMCRDEPEKAADLILMLWEKVEQLTATVEKQAATIAAQGVKITKLEAKLAKNSSNSSKPPSSDKNKSNRHRALLELSHEILGKHRDQWPVKGAFAVPVEMLESWILLGCHACEPENLPIFSSANRSGAKSAYAPQTPPPQLKDLSTAMKEELGFDSTKEFLLHCATEQIEPVDLAEQSRSFQFFHGDLLKWK